MVRMNRVGVVFLVPMSGPTARIAGPGTGLSGATILTNDNIFYFHAILSWSS